MKQRKGWIVLTVVVIFAVAVYAFREPLIRSTLPVVEEATLGELVLDNDSAFVKISLVIRNKGIWHIELTHVHLGIFDDSLRVMSYESDSIITFKRNELKTQVLYCTIPLMDVIERIREHQGKDSVGLHIRGVFEYTTFLGGSSSVVDHEMQVIVPIPPEIFIRRISYLGKENGVYNLEFDLTLKNDNARMLNMRDVTYELYAGNSIAVNGSIPSMSIAALDSTQIKVPASMKVDGHFGVISKIILDRDEMPYSFVMKGTIVSFTGVIDQDVSITVSATGQLELYNENRIDRPEFTVRKKHR